MKVYLLMLLMFFFACGKKNINKKEEFNIKNYDSIIVDGFIYNYKYDKIKKDSIVLGFNYKIVYDSLIFNKKNNNMYVKNFNILNKIGKSFYNGNPKGYKDYNLPEGETPELFVYFYKNGKKINEKHYIIIGDNTDYDPLFYKSLDFLYLLEIKNIQNESIDDFIINYKW